MDRQQQQGQPAFVSGVEAARLLSISLTHLYNLERAGKFGPVPVKIGRSTRFNRAELLAWAEAGCPSREDWQGMKADK